MGLVIIKYNRKCNRPMYLGGGGYFVGLIAILVAQYPIIPTSSHCYMIAVYTFYIRYYNKYLCSNVSVLSAR